MRIESQKPERAVLSRELSEFLVELSIALHRHSMYPRGHPSLGPAVNAVIRRAQRLLEDRPSIAFGVARRQLIIEGVTTDPNQPVLRRLAEGLHRHHIGAISIERGVQPDEFGEALQALATETDRQGPLGLTRGPHLTRWTHVRLHPLTFDRLALVGEAPLAGGTETDGTQASREAELWIGLARAALSADEVPISGPLPTAPAVVAKAIDEHPRAEAYDQVIVGYLLQIAHELKDASGGKAQELRRRTSRLIAALRPETLKRLVEMGGDTHQRNQFVLDATHGMAVDAVLEIVKAAADASGQSISHGLFRMLSKLAMNAEAGSRLVRPRADLELREQIQRLLEGWQLEDPNPEAYGRVLQHLATSSPREGTPLSAKMTGESDPLRVVQISLESGGFGPLVQAALDQIVQTGRTMSVLDLISSRPLAPVDVTRDLLQRLTRPQTLDRLVAREPLDVASLDALLPSLSLEGYECLVDALASSPHRGTRRRLLDRLASSRVDISTLVTKHLADPRWYVQRNMLVLLDRIGRVPEGFSVAPWAAHPDARVRCEAVRLQLGLPSEKDLAVARAIEDPDPRVLHLGLTAIQQRCPEDLVPRLIRLALDAGMTDPLRVLAITAVGRVRQPAVLGMLLRLTDGGWSMLGRFRLPAKTPVVLAALRALCESWSPDSRAAAVLAAAAESFDPEVRDAASSLTS